MISWKNIMDDLITKSQKEIEKYRQRIFKSKEECRRIFAREPFEKKIKTAFELYRRAEYLRKFKQSSWIRDVMWGRTLGICCIFFLSFFLLSCSKLGNKSSPRDYWRKSHCKREVYWQFWTWGLMPKLPILFSKDIIHVLNQIGFEPAPIHHWADGINKSRVY